MDTKKNIFILTGAGISKESGIQSFREKDGLWDNHRIEDVCTVEAFLRNPDLLNSIDKTFNGENLSDFEIEIRTQSVSRLNVTKAFVGFAKLTGYLTPVDLSVTKNSSCGIRVVEFFTFLILVVYDVGIVNFELGYCSSSIFGLLIVKVAPTMALDTLPLELSTPLSIPDTLIVAFSVSGENLLIILPRDEKLLFLNGSILDFLLFLNISNSAPTLSLSFSTIVFGKPSTGSGVFGIGDKLGKGFTEALPVTVKELDTAVSVTKPFTISETVIRGCL